MSLQDLANLKVTSVSKLAEPLSRAPGSIYVITHDEIVRSEAASIAEALRLAPNLEVRQLTATTYAITARGFGGNQADQNFSNELLVLIDGRSVYSPLYSGVYFEPEPNGPDRDVSSGAHARLLGQHRSAKHSCGCAQRLQMTDEPALGQVATI